MRAPRPTSALPSNWTRRRRRRVRRSALRPTPRRPRTALPGDALRRKLIGGAASGQRPALNQAPVRLEREHPARDVDTEQQNGTLDG